MDKIIIANIICFIASIMMLLVGLLKDKKQILIVQTIQMILSAVSNIILGGITGFVMNVLGCVRNMICYKGELKWIHKVILIMCALCLSLPFNKIGIIGALPVMANVIYVCSMNIKDVVKFKFILAFTTFLWCIHDFYIQVYVYGIFDIFTVLSHTFTSYRIIKDNKK